MLCRSCQAPNSEASLFCTSCGMRLAPPSPDQAARERTRAPFQDNAPAPPAGAPTAYGGSWSSQPGGQGQWPAAQGWTDERLIGDAAGHRASDVWSQPGALSLAPYNTSVQVYQKANVHGHTITCAECGLPRPSRMEACPGCGRVVLNTSGQGDLVPLEVAQGWNWGAFLTPIPWSIAHESWLGLLCLLPGFCFVVPFILGARGNELAWQNRRFHNMEHFQEVQRIWRNATISITAIITALFVIYIFSGG